MNILALNYFQLGIHFAENGLNVWHISQNRIAEIPKNIDVPNVETQKQLTFLYLENDMELLKHLNLAHTWYKCPNTVIIRDFEKYCNLSKDLTVTSYTLAVILNGLTACAKKHNSKIYLIIIYNSMATEMEVLLKRFLGTYFSKIIETSNESNEDSFYKVVNNL